MKTAFNVMTIILCISVAEHSIFETVLRANSVLQRVCSARNAERCHSLRDSVCPSVRPSVRPSRSGIVSRLIKIR